MSQTEARMSRVTFPAPHFVRREVESAAVAPASGRFSSRGSTMRALLASIRLMLVALFAVAFVGSSTALARGAEMRALEEVDYDGVFAETPAPPAGWRTVEGLYTRIHAHPDDLPTARHLADHADLSVPLLTRGLGVPSGATIEVFLAPDTETFRAMQPGTPPQWADGTAWPLRGLVYLRSNSVRIGTDEPLTQVLDHELVHIILGRAFSPRPVPRWLQEGAAQILAEQYSSELTDRLASGLLGGSLLKLDEITRGFPSDAGRARLAYAQSADLVAYLQNTYGEETLAEVTRGLASGKSVNQSLRDSTGVTAFELDRAWRSRITASPMWLKPLVADSTLLAVTGVIFVAGGVLVRRRRREILDRWAEDEKLQDAIYSSLVGPWPGVPLPLPPIPVLSTGWGSPVR